MNETDILPVRHQRAYEEEADKQDLIPMQFPDLSRRKKKEAKERKKYEKRAKRAARRRAEAERVEMETADEEQLQLEESHPALQKKTFLYDRISAHYYKTQYMEECMSRNSIAQSIEPANCSEATKKKFEIYDEDEDRDRYGNRSRSITHGYAPHVPSCETPPEGAVVWKSDPNNVYISEEERDRLERWNFLCQFGHLVSSSNEQSVKSILKQKSHTLTKGIDCLETISEEPLTISRSGSEDSLASASAPSFDMSPPISRSSSNTTICSLDQQTPASPPKVLRRCVTIPEDPVSTVIIIPRTDKYIYTEPSKVKRALPVPSSSSIVTQLSELIAKTGDFARKRTPSSDSVTSCSSTQAIHSTDHEEYYAALAISGPGAYYEGRKAQWNSTEVNAMLDCIWCRQRAYLGKPVRISRSHADCGKIAASEMNERIKRKSRPIRQESAQYMIPPKKRSRLVSTFSRKKKAPEPVPEWPVWLPFNGPKPSSSISLPWDF